jgi:hypothetical protein
MFVGIKFNVMENMIVKDEFKQLRKIISTASVV